MVCYVDVIERRVILYNTDVVEYRMFIVFISCLCIAEANSVCFTLFS